MYKDLLPPGLLDTQVKQDGILVLEAA